MWHFGDRVRVYLAKSVQTWRPAAWASRCTKLTTWCQLEKPRSSTDHEPSPGFHCLIFVGLERLRVGGQRRENDSRRQMGKLGPPASFSFPLAGNFRIPHNGITRIIAFAYRGSPPLPPLYECSLHQRDFPCLYLSALLVALSTTSTMKLPPKRMAGSSML